MADALSDERGLTQFGLKRQPLDKFIDRLFLRFLTRHPTEMERKIYSDVLERGYDTRIAQRVAAVEATAPTHTYRKLWPGPIGSARFEDVICALVNAPELTQSHKSYESPPFSQFLRHARLEHGIVSRLRQFDRLADESTT